MLFARLLLIRKEAQYRTSACWLSATIPPLKRSFCVWQREQRFSEARVRFYAAEIVSALQFMHQVRHYCAFC
jgi:hypothetical protein